MPPDCMVSCSKIITLCIKEICILCCCFHFDIWLLILSWRHTCTWKKLKQVVKDVLRRKCKSVIRSTGWETRKMTVWNLMIYILFMEVKLSFMQVTKGAFWRMFENICKKGPLQRPKSVHVHTNVPPNENSVGSDIIHGKSFRTINFTCFSLY
jgi:hypothetical protein